MAIWINFLTFLGSLCVLSGVSQAAPVANQVPQRPNNLRLPFSLDLEPPLFDNDNGAAAKRAILPLKDSYGNPIEPSTLAVPNDFIGNSPAIDSAKSVITQGIKFAIPSYASGITEIRKPNNDLLPPPIDSRELLPPQSNQGVKPPPNDLLPPFQNTPKDVAINEISGKALEERFGPDFNLKQLPNAVNDFLSASIPNGIGFSQLPSSSSPPITPSQAEVAGLKPSSPVSGTGKYTGGFGGASGILGDQKIPGSAVKPVPLPAAPPVFEQSIPQPIPQQPIPQQPIPQQPIPQQQPQPLQPKPSGASSNGKYTGGFGGPPGILVPFDNKSA